MTEIRVKIWFRNGEHSLQWDTRELSRVMDMFHILTVVLVPGVCFVKVTELYTEDLCIFTEYKPYPNF